MAIPTLIAGIEYYLRQELHVTKYHNGKSANQHVKIEREKSR